MVWAPGEPGAFGSRREYRSLPLTPAFPRPCARSPAGGPYLLGVRDPAVLSQPLPVTAAPCGPLGSSAEPKVTQARGGHFRWPVKGLELALSRSHFSLLDPFLLPTPNKGTHYCQSPRGTQICHVEKLDLALVKIENQFSNPSGRLIM